MAGKPGRSGGARKGSGPKRIIGPKASEGKPVRNVKAKQKAKKHKWPKRECTHEKPAFANGKLRKKCFDCYPKPDPRPRKQFMWKQVECMACKCCSNEFSALGLNRYCSEQCKALQTKQLQRVKDEDRRTNLKSGYIASILKLPVKLIPDSLIELKREQLKIQRLLRSRKQS